MVITPLRFWKSSLRSCAISPMRAPVWSSKSKAARPSVGVTPCHFGVSPILAENNECVSIRCSSSSVQGVLDFAPTVLSNERSRGFRSSRSTFTATLARAVIQAAWFAAVLRDHPRSRASRKSTKRAPTAFVRSARGTTPTASSNSVNALSVRPMALSLGAFRETHMGTMSRRVIGVAAESSGFGTLGVGGSWGVSMGSPESLFSTF